MICGFVIVLWEIWTGWKALFIALFLSPIPIDAGVDIITPECAVPLQTPVNNLKTIVEVCQNN